MTGSKYSDEQELEKLNKLMEWEGYGISELTSFIHDCCSDSLVPGICMNSECEFTTYYEPDQGEGYCDLCQTNTVVSALILLGVI